MPSNSVAMLGTREVIRDATDEIVIFTAELESCLARLGQCLTDSEVNGEYARDRLDYAQRHNKEIAEQLKIIEIAIKKAGW